MLRLGLACTGWAATWAVHDAVSRGGCAEVVFVASRDERRAAAYAAGHGVRGWGTWEDLLSAPEVDAVYVAGPNRHHARWTLEAVEAGKHVLCEKPLTRNRAEAEAIVAAAARQGVVVWEAMHYRHHPAVARVLDAVRAGRFGRVEEVEVEFGWCADRPDDPRWAADLDGGALLDVGCYGLDLARNLLGDELAVVGAAAAMADTGVDRECRIELASTAGRGAVTASLDRDFVCRATVRTARSGSGPTTIELDRPFLPVTPGSEGERFNARVDDLLVAEADGVATSYSEQLAGFAAAVAQGGPNDPEIVVRAALLSSAWAAVQGASSR